MPGAKGYSALMWPSAKAWPFNRNMAIKQERGHSGEARPFSRNAAIQPKLGHSAGTRPFSRNNLWAENSKRRGSEGPSHAKSCPQFSMGFQALEPMAIFTGCP